MSIIQYCGFYTVNSWFIENSDLFKVTDVPSKTQESVLYIVMKSSKNLPAKFHNSTYYVKNHIFTS